MPADRFHPDYPIDAFQTALLDWYQRQQRSLPWRHQPSAYKTVVSEFMLQQTQVKTVLPYFAAWLKRFPDFKALAAADEAEVVRAWEGLGYYTRARNLHRLAKTVAALPRLPKTRSAWLELPGIGPYTSAAITSIAFGQPEACVDGNVVRILSRIHADTTAYRDSASASKAFAPLAEQLLNRFHPGDHNQAMMELGATVCHRQSPLCTVCPVFRFCRAGRQGDPEGYPRLAAKAIERVEIDRAWCLRDEALLLHQAAKGAKRLALLHELPALGDLGLERVPKNAKLLTTERRGITRFLYTEKIWSVEMPALPLPPGLRWVRLSELEDITLSGPHRRWIRKLLGRENGEI